GIDLKPDAVAAANRVVQAHGLSGQAIAGNLGQLPFPDESFDLVFSYGVLQHVPKSLVATCLSEVHRVLKPNGVCLIEFPLWPGLTNRLRRTECHSEDPACWQARYYRWGELQANFSRHFDEVTIKADCIFGIGIQFEDIDIMPWYYKPIVALSEGFRRMSETLPPLVRLSDSVYVRGRKR